MQRQAPPVFASVARRPAVVISSSATRLSPIHPRSKGTKYDLVLSSGFLAFANHCGFLQAVDDVGLPVNGIMGTSAGALIGSLYAAGWSPRDIVAEFAKLTPIQRLSYHDRPWEGMLSMEKLIGELESLLPRSFADLKRDFACAVVCANGRHVLLDRGQLAAAVSASAAIPMLFRPVTLPDRHDGPFIDGGIRCRIGLDLWRQHRYGGDSDAHPAVVHLIGRSSPFSGNDSTAGLANQNAVVVQSPKSGVTFWSYGDYEHQFEAARQRALPVLLALLDTEGEGNSSADANNGANNAVPAGTAGSSSPTAAGRQAASAAGSNSI